MWQFVRGSTFTATVQFQLGGNPVDLTNWAITAQVHDSTGDTHIADLSAVVLDAAAGTVTFSASGTGAWPPAKARIDALVRDPQGNQYVSPPDYFRIVDTPLSV